MIYLKGEKSFVLFCFFFLYFLGKRVFLDTFFFSLLGGLLEMVIDDVREIRGFRFG